ncbi:hypothetical protein AB4343_02530 [Vibrio breoganii]|uniref:Uncharacterized protein n=1 Tax=Vibrio breoganii TaxID=553239 RepID=A0AAP8SWC5_9VIBR|nr:hypothetical protein [Vibrio breoganii]OEF82889.1 hypothetical protein B003_09450 [Vibrio breoganii 1C10]PMG04661.1 hypothetical protein BCV00_14765 [Vibrio breoganii]PMG83391.1 hypothetical protein BCU81_15335 [Vibrio breoganii]PMG95168.1 hypothetical protein BCU79_10535 [Vibrio breoganii]PMH19545.1 hypothetical protein BCU74_05705 [Vibrio breoganii]
MGAESYWLIALAMAGLSVWKTYTGPALAGFLSLSYPEMFMFNVLPAMAAGGFGWYFGSVLHLPLPFRKQVHFRPKLRKFLRAWNNYGQVSMALLAPILIGIPLFTLVSRKLKQRFATTFLLLFISILLCSGISYFGFLLFNWQEYIPIDALLPAR